MSEPIPEQIPDDAASSAFALRNRQVDTDEGNVTISMLVCEPLERAGFINAFCSDRLQIAPPVLGDEKQSVAENRRRFLKAIRAEGVQIVTARQTHSTERCTIESAAQARGPQPECDAMITRM